MEIPKNLTLPQKSRFLLGELQSKKINLLEFLKECASWALSEGWDDIQVMPYPFPPPKVVEFETLPIEKRSRLDNQYYLDFLEVNQYYDYKFKIYNRNKAMKNWLIEIQHYTPQEDRINHAKIEEKLNKVNDWLIKSDFYVDRRTQSNEITEEVKDVLDSFGGEIV